MNQRIFKIFSLLLIPGISLVILLILFSVNPHSGINLKYPSHLVVLFIVVVVFVSTICLNLLAFIRLEAKIKNSILFLLRVIFPLVLFGIFLLDFLIIETIINGGWIFNFWVYLNLSIITLVLPYVIYKLFIFHKFE